MKQSSKEKFKELVKHYEKELKKLDNKEITILRADLSTLRKHSQEIGRKFTHYYDAFFKEQKTVKKLEIRLATYGQHKPECLSLRINPGPRAKCNCGWEKIAKGLI